jgi:uncharacterized surface protein with fasciclin (FAS1) repeats
LETKKLIYTQNKNIMKIKNQIIKMLLLLTATFTIFSCTDDDTNKEIIKLPTILEIAQADPANFSILISALKQTKLDATVSSQGSYTVFAPTNAVFAAAGYTEASIAALDTGKTNDLRKLLQNHILGVGSKAEDLIAAGYSRTFSPFGTSTSITLSMYINKDGSDVIINGGVSNGGAKVVTADIDASNGVVHVVNGIIGLPTLLSHAIANPNLSTLKDIISSGNGGTFGDQSAVKTVLGSASTTAPLTVFAPTNTAFKAATEGDGFLTGTAFTQVNITKTLQYHVTKGNLTSSSSSSWTPATATGDVTITTLLEVAPTPAQKFTILKGSLNIKETSTTVTASKIILTNVQASNGVVQVIDRVLKPVL